ncbi:hypothetical protein BDN72DRAFT_679479 [Pluteus cervinus]|uniref:Uncharacterized protein n=1 Tax=Pluteus cervinus TaxID=181527 RepID=A0ACD2ZZD1_9AGAR|nr:hypothetical protein BDN72DRAFT_679479 [Pluteus cervinus]
MGGAEEFGFVGHSDYLVAIIPISTLNFDALCPNLTKAVITGFVTARAFRTILATLRNLKELEIGLVVVDDLKTTPTTKLQHDHLKSLKLRSNVGVATMLKDLKFSELKEFTLWLAPLAALECQAKDFDCHWETPYGLNLNFTPSDKTFSETVEHYGITVHIPEESGYILPKKATSDLSV